MKKSVAKVSYKKTPFRIVKLKEAPKAATASFLACN